MDKELKEGKFFLARDGFRKIKKEYEKLSVLKKEKLAEKISPVFDSEEVDAEFVSFREEIEFLDKRLIELEYILKNFEFIKIPPKQNRDRVFLGAVVIVKQGEKEKEFMVVDSLEADPNLGKISCRSPLGCALLGKKVGDKIILDSPKRTVYEIKAIRYDKKLL